MPRIRTINQAFKELKEADPNTALSPHSIRQLILKGEISAFRSGNKVMFDCDELMAYMANQPKKRQNNVDGIIRSIKVR